MMAIRPDAAWVAKALPARRREAHKGSFGTLAVLAGSRSYRGAAVLAAAGALRCGTGIVRVASTSEVCATVAAQLPCCPLLQLDTTVDGGIAPNGAGRTAALAPSAILAGSGLGNTCSTAQLVEQLLAAAKCPLVLDADALNVLAGHFQGESDPACAQRLCGALRRYAGGEEHPAVLTPHIGEAARLAGLPAAEVQRRQEQVARQLAERLACVVVLKSHITVVAAPGGPLAVNDEAGNPGLAKGGSGDVLAGVIAGLLAQGLHAFNAAVAGVWLHAAAGDAAREQYGTAGLSPADLPLAVARVLHEIER